MLFERRTRRLLPRIFYIEVRDLPGFVGRLLMGW